MKLNKKGFSMVEIIATVAILGVISTIAIIAVTNIIEQGKIKHYESAEKTIKMSAESYAQANRKYLPKNVGDKKQIYLKQLEEDNYIEEVHDYYDKKCYADQSYVQIFKYSKTDYSYMTYLKCPDYSNEEAINEGVPSISIDMTEPSDNNVKKTTAKVTIEDDKKLLSYSITIYKNGTEIYTTGNIEANYEKKITKTYDISKYTPGKIKVVAKAINIYGLDDTKSKEYEYKDKQKPECIIAEEDRTRDNDDWINQGTRTITVGCDDGEEGSGCARDTFTKTFEDDAKEGYIEIKDKAGNKTRCEVDVYIDKTPPNSCSVTHSARRGLGQWYVENATVTLTSGDVLSGVKYNSLTTSSSKPTSDDQYNGLITGIQTDTTGIVWYGYVEDYAGNTSDCVSTTMKVDTVAPTQPSGGSMTLSGATAETTLGAVDNSTDETSKLKEYRYYVIKETLDKTITAPANTNDNFKTNGNKFTRECGYKYAAYAIAVDNAGNKSTVHKIDEKFDNASEYKTYSACSEPCDGGTKESINECALVTKKDVQECNTKKCCRDGSITYKDGTTCSAACNGGTYNQVAYAAEKPTKRCSSYDKTSGGGTCNSRTCCDDSHIKYKDGTSCYGSCGTGTYNKIAYSTYANDYSIRCSAYDTTSGGSSCDTGTACCSAATPTGCPQMHSCRKGKTFITNKSDRPADGKTNFEGTVSTSQTLYVVSTSGNKYYVYVENGGKFNNSYYPESSKNFGYIYKNCVEPIGTSCEFAQCPDN